MSQHREHWDEMVSYEKNGDLTEEGFPVVRMNGKHYIMYPSDRTSMGKRGMEMLIVFSDGPLAGESIYSNNIWCQGDIPAEYLDKLPSNAYQGQDWVLQPFEREGYSLENWLKKQLVQLPKTNSISADIDSVD